MKLLKIWVDLRMRAKLGLGFGVCLALTILMGLLAVDQSKRLSTVAVSMHESTLAETAMRKIEFGAKGARTFEYRFILATKPAEMDGIKATVAKMFGASDEGIASLGQHISSPESKDAYEQAKKCYEDFKGVTDIALSLHADSQSLDDILTVSKTKITPPLLKFDDAIVTLTKALDKEDQSRLEAVRSTAAGGQRTMFGLMFLTALFGIASANILTRYVVSNVATVRDLLTRIATGRMTDLALALGKMEHGDLTGSLISQRESVEVRSHDEFGEMLTAANLIAEKGADSVDSFLSAQQNIKKIIEGTKSAADRVDRTSQSLAEGTDQTGKASTEIANGSGNLASEASNAAAVMSELHGNVTKIRTASDLQLVEVTAAAKEMNQSVDAIQTVSANAAEVTKVSTGAAEKMRSIVAANEQIQKQVEESGRLVMELDDAGRKIGSIVQTIGSISEQTNLLALNAAIEAARAGEHGRGFAVVADEVRKLAEQASSSTREIGDLVQLVSSSVDMTVKAIAATRPLVDKGTALSEEAAEVLAQVAENAGTSVGEIGKIEATEKAIAKRMNQVLQAAQQNVDLSSAIEDGASNVIRAIENVAAISEETAATVQELSAGAQEVSQTAGELHAMASQLRTEVAKFKTEDDAAKRPNLRVA